MRVGVGSNTGLVRNTFEIANREVDKRVNHLIVHHLLGTVILLQHGKKFDDIGVLGMKISNWRDLAETTEVHQRRI